MSKQNNVNPGQYYDGGRERTEGPDKGHRTEEAKEAMGQQRHDDKMEGKEGQPNYIPGEAPVGQPGKSSSRK